MLVGIRQHYDSAGDEPFNVGVRQKFESEQVVSLPPIRTECPRHLESWTQSATVERRAGTDAEFPRFEQPRQDDRLACYDGGPLHLEPRHCPDRNLYRSLTLH